MALLFWPGPSLVRSWREGIGNDWKIRSRVLGPKTLYANTYSGRARIRPLHCALPEGIQLFDSLLPRFLIHLRDKGAV